MVFANFEYDDEDFNIDEISGEAKWYHIGNVIRYSVAQNLSQNKTSIALREIGFTFGNMPFRQLYRTITATNRAFTEPTQIDPDDIPDDRFIVRLPSIPDGKYGYYYDVSHFDPNLDTITNDRIFFTDTQLFTSNELSSLVDADFMGWVSPKEGELIDWNYVGLGRSL